MALRVFGIVNHDAHGTPTLPELKTFVLRDLTAVYEEAEYTVQGIGSADTQHHLDVVSALFANDAVLPTPVGTVFRNTEVLERWMDIHYVALSDALAWVEDRIAARVHINRADGKPGDKDAGTDLAAVAAEATRSLRRHAVSVVPLRNEGVTGIVLSAAYLVERQLWKEFLSAVDDEREKHSHISVEVTGPWPPYDFVRLQFGA